VLERLDEQARRHMRYDHNRDDPSKNKTEYSRENDISISRD
jgi:hypothetical protein